MPLQKVGPHIIRPTPEAMRWAARAHVVKAMDTTAPFEVAQPHALRIFRHHFTWQNVEANPQHVFAELMNALGAYRHPQLLVEVFNELPRQMTSVQADLLEKVVPLLKREGLRVIGPCWATGDFEQAEWEEMRRRKWCGLDGIALHAYWGMTHGLPLTEIFTPWNALRYRSYWKPGDPPVFITETGRDYVRDAPGGAYAGKKGWKNDGLTAEDFIAELEHYEHLLSQDPYVWGATVFTAGPTDDWRAFGTDEISDRFVVDPNPPSWAVVKPVERVEPKPAPKPAKPAPKETKPVTLKKHKIGGLLEVVDVRDRFPYVNGEYRPRARSRITGVVMHHSATHEVSSDAQTLALLDAIQGWHTGTTAGSPYRWPALGYHFAINSAGKIFWLNGLELVSYHAGGVPVIDGIGKANWDNIGIVWLGDFTSKTPTPTMIEAADILVDALEIELGERALAVIGHKEVPGAATACPGAHWATTKAQMAGSADGPDLLSLWEASFLGPVYRAFVAGTSLPGATPEDDRDMTRIFELMRDIKRRKGWE